VTPADYPYIVSEISCQRGGHCAARNAAGSGKWSERVAASGPTAKIVTLQPRHPLTLRDMSFDPRR
jgi:hypothetical protein